MSYQGSAAWQRQFKPARVALRGPQMVFPDNRFKSPTAYGDFGLTFVCNDLDAALTELKQLLETAKNAGLLTTHWFTANEGDPVAVSAQATYDGITNNNVIIMSDGACAANTAEAQHATQNLRDLLSATSVGVPPPLRPDYEKQAPIPSPDVPLWVKIGGFTLLGTVSVVALAYLVGQGATIAKVFKATSRKRYAGRRR